MKPISQLTISDLQNIKVLCFDCDGVTVPKGTFINESGDHLSITTKHPHPQFVDKISKLKQNYQGYGTYTRV